MYIVGFHCAMYIVGFGFGLSESVVDAVAGCRQTCYACPTVFGEVENHRRRRGRMLRKRVTHARGAAQRRRRHGCVRRRCMAGMPWRAVGRSRRYPFPGHFSDVSRSWRRGLARRGCARIVIFSEASASRAACLNAVPDRSFRASYLVLLCNKASFLSACPHAWRAVGRSRTLEQPNRKSARRQRCRVRTLQLNTYESARRREKSARRKGELN